MDGSFACPECGCEVRVAGLSPGRTVRCGWCRTAVEVPYLPRADQITRMRRDRAWRRARRFPRWALAAAAVLCVAIALAVVYRAARSRWASRCAEELSQMVASSREAEQAGRLNEALATLEGALALGGRSGCTPAGLDGLRARRDVLSLRDAEGRLAALESTAYDADPAQGVGQALTLRARATKDGALETLGARIDAAVDRHRLRWAEADAASAREAEAADQPVRALELAERLHRTAGELSRPLRRRLQTEAEDLAGRVVARHGTVIEPVRGRFAVGSPSDYAALLFPVIHEQMRKAGYLPKPVSSPWGGLWEAQAPYRFHVEVAERQDGDYLGSANRLSEVEATVTLSRRGAQVWRQTHKAKTQVPLPGLSAYQASRGAVGDRRSREFERLLYDDARANLVDRVGYNLRHLAPCCPEPTGAP